MEQVTCSMGDLSRNTGGCQNQLTQSVNLRFPKWCWACKPSVPLPHQNTGHITQLALGLGTNLLKQQRQTCNNNLNTDMVFMIGQILF